MTRLQELLQEITNSSLSIEILEGVLNDLMLNYQIEEDDIIGTLQLNLEDWDK